MAANIQILTVDAPSGPMRQTFGRLRIESRPRSMYEFTGAVVRWLDEIEADAGLLSIFLQHTSASLTIQENADADVQADLLDALEWLAPSDGRYRHGIEGSDDMPAHIKTALTGVSLSIPVLDGQMDLGTWQGIYLIEHRARPHMRSLTFHFAGV